MAEFALAWYRAHQHRPRFCSTDQRERQQRIPGPPTNASAKQGTTPERGVIRSRAMTDAEYITGLQEAVEYANVQLAAALDEIASIRAHDDPMIKALHEGQEKLRADLEATKAALVNVANDSAGLIRKERAERDAARAELESTKEEWDGTDGAHPCWWRGHDDGAKGMAAALAKARSALLEIEQLAGRAHVDSGMFRVAVQTEALRGLGALPKENTGDWRVGTGGK